MADPARPDRTNLCDDFDQAPDTATRAAQRLAAPRQAERGISIGALTQILRAVDEVEPVVAAIREQARRDGIDRVRERESGLGRWRTRTWRTRLFAMFLSILLTTVLLVQSASTGQASTGAITIRSEGQELVLSPDDLAKVKRHEHQADAETLSGVLLWDLLQMAKVPSPKASGRQRAVMYMKLTGADGQSAVMALVDVDPSFSKRLVLVADRRNGKPLDATEGPWRVFIPDDIRHARWIRGLVAVEVLTVK